MGGEELEIDQERHTVHLGCEDLEIEYEGEARVKGTDVSSRVAQSYFQLGVEVRGAQTTSREEFMARLRSNMVPSTRTRIESSSWPRPLNTAPAHFEVNSTSPSPVSAVHKAAPFRVNRATKGK